MPLLTKTFQIVAGILAIPIVGGAILAGNYSSPFTFHLADIINGPSTTVVAATNAPNWSVAVPMYQVVSISAATTTGGTMASSTPEVFAVAALDGTGTTTLSNTLSATTDASTTLLGSEAYEITWNPVQGATGYAIYFGGTASSLTNYFLATTTNAFYFASSTVGNLTGSYTKNDTTAFSLKINPQGSSYINGANGTATTTAAASTTAWQINGNIVAVSAATTSGCVAADAGQMFYNTSNGHEWGCSGTQWVKIF
jgi:hypothetical protein